MTRTMYMEGDWYLFGGTTLYIIPPGDREPWGPSDAMMRRLLAFEPGVAFEDWLRQWSLVRVPVERRRWSPERGFYVGLARERRTER